MRIASMQLLTSSRVVAGGKPVSVGGNGTTCAWTQEPEPPIKITNSLSHTCDRTVQCIRYEPAQLYELARLGRRARKRMQNRDDYICVRNTFAARVCCSVLTYLFRGTSTHTHMPYVHANETTPVKWTHERSHSHGTRRRTCRLQETDRSVVAAVGIVLSPNGVHNVLIDNDGHARALTCF